MEQGARELVSGHSGCSKLTNKGADLQIPPDQPYDLGQVTDPALGKATLSPSQHSPQ